MNNNTIYSNIIKHTINNVKYKKLNETQKIDYIKKAKLSFYYEVDENLQDLYLNYYFEMFPIFKEKYIKADDKEKEILLDSAINKSKIYRDKFIKNNQKLIAYVIKNYETSISKEELFQIGNISLISVLKLFDINKNIKFSTYAVSAIKRNVQRFIDNNETTIRMPVYNREKKRKLIKAKTELENNLQRKPTINELIEKTGFTENKILEIENFDYYKANPISTNTIVYDEDEITVEDIIPDTSKSFTDEIYNSMLIDALINDHSLTNQEKKVLQLRYGFIDGKPYSVKEIVKMLGITRTSVYKAELSGLNKLRTIMYNSNDLNSNLKQKTKRK